MPSRALRLVGCDSIAGDAPFPEAGALAEAEVLAEADVLAEAWNWPKPGPPRPTYFVLCYFVALGALWHQRGDARAHTHTHTHHTHHTHALIQTGEHAKGARSRSQAPRSLHSHNRPPRLPAVDYAGRRLNDAALVAGMGHRARSF